MRVLDKARETAQMQLSAQQFNASVPAAPPHQLQRLLASVLQLGPKPQILTKLLELPAVVHDDDAARPAVRRAALLDRP